jgi:hypothetical protein
LTEFTLSFFDGVADTDFEAVAVGGDGLSVCDFHGDLAGENCFESAILIEDLEGFAFDFDDTGNSVDTEISGYIKGLLL